MESLGFDVAKKAKKAGRSVGGSFRFTRNRDGFEDKVEFYWDKWGRPRFMIQFMTSQTERMKTPGGSGVVEGIWGRFGPGRRAIWQKLFGILGDSWYGTYGSVKDTVGTAKTRLIQLDSYLRTGQPNVYVWAG